MINDLSRAAQDYLKMIYRLQNRHGRATTSQLADQLDLTPASVTGMLQKMAQTQPPLVVYEKHQGVTLTPAGERAALEMVRHHRLLELFLHEKLGYAWDEVHEEAEQLEHVISEKMERRIAAALGDPRRDPHGAPIPDRDLQLAPRREFPLSELEPGQRAIVQRVRDEDAELLRYVASLGLRPEAGVTAVAHSPLDQTLTIQVEGQTPVVIGPRVAAQIFVDIATNVKKEPNHV
jgi:DtxR family Mn-dependent transcriptional regulator